MAEGSGVEPRGTGAGPRLDAEHRDDTPGVLTVGLTGNAGSGKSTVARIWQERGAEVVDADALSRDLLDADRELRRQLAIEFGEQVLEPSASADVGALRRAELARLAFASPERTRALNRLVHPPLIALLERRLDAARRRHAPGPPDGAEDDAEGAAGTKPSRWGATGRCGLVVVDAALIFELGVEPLFDRIVLVTAPLEARLERLRARGLDEATISGLLASQTPDSDKAAHAGHVLVNDSSLEYLRAQSLETLARIFSLPDPEPTRPRPGEAAGGTR